ncbi:MAG TPA: PHP domain-containing protein [Polyangiaceae bacterium]|nr:PHP domain-containing protein [Polyangiaceae bacterium]
MQDAAQVRSGLEELAALVALSGGAAFKVKAYRRAAELVHALGDQLSTLIEQDRLAELEGIGPSLSRQIQELWNHGTSSYLAKLRSEQPPGAGELFQVEGVTPRRLQVLHDALGVSSVEQLAAACRAGQVRSLPRFGDRTEQRLLAAAQTWLAHNEEGPRELLLPRARELARALLHDFAEIGLEAHVAGALRRGEELLSELELVVVGEASTALHQIERLRRVVTVDAERHVARLSVGLPLRLRFTSRERLGNALVAATGSAAHLAQIDARDVSLRERPFADETALYGALGLATVPPELREGRNELELAARDDFGDWLDAGQVRGLVHCHTEYSDGRQSVLDMARAAHALGMHYIAITDHSPSAHYARGVAIDRLKQQWDEIAAAEAVVPIRILRGTESDILADGSLDFPDAILEQLEVVIASIHARYRMDRQAMTARLRRALSLPLFKIWGHPLGRIINHRPPIDCDVLELLDTLAEAPGAIELNADPHRLDLPPAWIPAARERGLRFVISVDAHSTRGFGVLDNGIDLARRGGVRTGEVLNTLGAEEFARAVRPRPG